MTVRAFRCERGAVMVITALALFGMVSLMTFAIDISHWFDYSRNLQNRADAAALAAGDAFGNACFSGNPGTTQTGAQSAIGKWAQLYSGAGVAEPAGNLPYTDAQVSASATNPVSSGGPGTGWNVAANGYINNTLPGSPVPSPLTLKAGSLTDYSVRLNANNYATKPGSTNFAMGDFCNGDPTFDETDPQCFGQAHGQTSGPCAVGPMADVKVSQFQLPNFITIFNVHPNITAHARVALQGIASEKGVRPLAVGDASYIPCVTANFLNADGATIASEKLIEQKDANNNPTGVWDSSKDAKAISMPSGNPVTVQLFLNNCVASNPSGTKYDYVDSNGKEQKIGLVYINNWGSPTSPATAPEIDTGGVTLVGATQTQCDPYFQSSTGSCSVDVDAHVSFPAPGSGVSYFVRAVDAGANTSCVPAGGKACNSVDLNKNGAPTEWQSAVAAGGAGPFSFGSDSGPHNIDIWTAQLGGSVGGKACNKNGNAWATSNQNCWTDLGTQQRAFSGIDGTNLCSDPNFDTGPMQWITVGQEDAAGNIVGLTGENAYGGSASPHLFIETKVAGLSNSGPTDPPICLRVGESTSHDTGLIICPPQTSGGTTNDIQAIVNGCDPLQINTRLQPDGSLTCSPTITPNDCVTNDTGQSPPILKGFDQLVCTNGGNPVDKWPTVSITDPRSLVFVVTAPVDFTLTNGTTQNPIIPIRNFAVFYVEGWSTGQGGVQGCSNNTSPPPGAGNGEIWGHWTSLEVPGGLGTGNGDTCKANQFGNCVAALTR